MFLKIKFVPGLFDHKKKLVKEAVSGLFPAGTDQV